MRTASIATSLVCLLAGFSGCGPGMEGVDAGVPGTSARLRVVHLHSCADGSHRLDAARLDERCPDWSTRHAHVCGPVSMLDAAEAMWADAGLSEQLHLERFHPARPTRPTGTAGSADGTPSAVAWFSTSDVVAPAPDSTPLLEVAESAGLTPAFGCRMGICRTCTTRLDSGCVRDLRDGRTHGDGEHVQLCVSAADGDVVLNL